jgi:hypothetical protein
MRQRLGIVLILLLCFPVLAFAATYYVSFSGSDANPCAPNDSTPSNAKRTMTGISGANSCMSGGDTVLVYPDGLYTDTAWCSDTKNLPSGTVGAPTTIKSATPGTRVQWRPSLAIPPGDCSNYTYSAIWIGNARSYITFEEFEIDGTAAQGDSNDRNAIDLANPAANITIRNFRFINWSTSDPGNPVRNCIFTGNATSFLTFQQIIFEDCGANSANGHDIYHQGDDSLFDRNHHVHTTGSVVNGITALWINDGTGIAERNVVRRSFFDTSTTAVVQNLATSGADGRFEYNVLRGAVSGIATGYNASIPGSNANNYFYHNVILNCSGDGVEVGLFATTTGQRLYNNIVQGCGGRPVRIYSNGVNTDLQSNSYFSNTGGDTIADAGTGTTQSGALTTDPLLTNIGANDFTLASGSPALNSGVQIAGLNFCGSNPDRGALESPVRVSGEIGLVNDTTVVETYCVVQQPLTAAVLGNYSARVDTVARTINSLNIVGSTQVHLVLASAVTGGQAVDVTCTYGCVSDGSNLGNQSIRARILAYTQQSVTNNVGGGAPVYTQAHFRLGRLHVAAASPQWLTDQDLSRSWYMGGRVRVNACVSSAAAPAQAYRFFANQDGGAYQELTETCGAFGLCLKADDAVNTGDVTVNRLSLDGHTFVAGAFIEGVGSFPSLTLNAGECAEWELALMCTTTSLYGVRVYRGDGVAFNTYLQTPDIACGVARRITR